MSGQHTVYSSDDRRSSVALHSCTIFVNSCKRTVATCVHAAVSSSLQCGRLRLSAQPLLPSMYGARSVSYNSVLFSAGVRLSSFDILHRRQCILNFMRAHRVRVGKFTKYFDVVKQAIIATNYCITCSIQTPSC
jgi:hypothetical protein